MKMNDLLVVLRNLIVFSLSIAPASADTSECMQFCNQNRRKDDYTAFGISCKEESPYDSSINLDSISGWGKDCPYSCKQSSWYKPGGGLLGILNCPKGQPPKPEPEPEKESPFKYLLILFYIIGGILVFACFIGGITACVYCERRQNRYNQNVHANPTNAHITPPIGYAHQTMIYPKQAMVQVQIQQPLMQPQNPISRHPQAPQSTDISTV